MRLEMFALVLVSAGVCASPASAKCGVEQWDVKTGSDADAGLVDLAHPKATTIAFLAGLPAPVPFPPPRRVKPTEVTVWTLNCTLKGAKLEADEDYHLVLADDAGNTMIAEIPVAQCVDASSPFAAAIGAARTTFDHTWPAVVSQATAPQVGHQGGGLIPINARVTISGVGFFDRLHGQTGVAPNAIELHPVLSIALASGAPAAKASEVAVAPGAPAAPAAPASPCAPAKELLKNSALEPGQAGWKATKGVLVHSNRDEQAHSGDGMAWLGGHHHTHHDVLSQTVEIPASAAQARLSFFLHVFSDVRSDKPVDQLLVQVRDPGGAVLETLGTFSNRDENEGFEPRSFDLSAHRGQSVEIVFLAVESPGRRTSFLVDDVSLSTP